MTEVRKFFTFINNKTGKTPSTTFKLKNSLFDLITEDDLDYGAGLLINKEKNFLGFPDNFKAKKVEISSCNNLIFLSRGNNLFIEHYLEITSCNSLITLPKNLKTPHLYISICSEFSILPENLVLNQLIIYGCPKFMSFPSNITVDFCKIDKCKNFDSKFISKSVNIKDLIVNGVKI